MLQPSVYFTTKAHDFFLLILDSKFQTIGQVLYSTCNDCGPINVLFTLYILINLRKPFFNVRVLVSYLSRSLELFSSHCWNWDIYRLFGMPDERHCWVCFVWRLFNMLWFFIKKNIYMRTHRISPSTSVHFFSRPSCWRYYLVLQFTKQIRSREHPLITRPLSFSLK